MPPKWWDEVPEVEPKVLDDALGSATENCCTCGHAFQLPVGPGEPQPVRLRPAPPASGCARSRATVADSTAVVSRSYALWRRGALSVAVQVSSSLDNTSSASVCTRTISESESESVCFAPNSVSVPDWTLTGINILRATTAAHTRHTGLSGCHGERHRLGWIRLGYEEITEELIYRAPSDHLESLHFCALHY